MNPKHLLYAVIIALAVASCGNAEIPRGELKTETYTVKAGDTLWTISEHYIQKNTYGPRDIREFYHGVIEINSDSVLKGRVPGDIRPGDQLQINYFVK